ncbi:Utp14 protein-domain-containing protein [Irpex rosettiformis]|uniref:Utp14 protein-domain-containing protein n=1 Tax=Irpex rosettiformis TaxID=378272 RepID=A0ACB8UIH8_9APHY|nr:Utp14 protein-domain-containing protein [Irpex rosettiformis]
MARSQQPSKPFKSGTRSSSSSQKSFNASGYAKRKSLKSKTLSSGSLGDVYEYQTDKVRRGKLKLKLEKDEIAGAGRPMDEDDGSEDEGGAASSLRPRLLGENDDDDEIGEDEDEEIDSDEAFEESDEERYAGFSFAGSKKSGSKKKIQQRKKPVKSAHLEEVDLNEDSDDAQLQLAGEDDGSEEEEEEEEGDPDEFIDVLDMLDGRGEPQSEDDIKKVDKRGHHEVRAQVDDEDESASSEEDDDEEEDDDADEPIEPDYTPSDLEDEDPSALANLETFITNLDAGRKRKAPEDEPFTTQGQQDRATRKRRLLKEQTQVGVENEFAAQPGSMKLNIDDLLAPLAPSTTLQSLKKSVKVLTSTSNKTKTLSAPLPQRTQEKLDREAAYEQTKGEIDKWSATMRRIKEAEHLSFPLQAESAGKVSNLELAAKFKPTTPLESNISTLLKSAQMREQDLAHTESLKMNHLSVQEVAERRAELGRMRELMFRAEVKAKRVARIKSKAFRRLRKKARGKEKGKLGDGEEEDEGEEGEEAVLKREVERARERATLRHKNTGKWARGMKGRGEVDGDQRREINEMLERGERLRRRVQGRGSDDDSGSDEESGSGEAEDTIRAGAFDELRRLEEGGGGEEVQGKKGKSVFEMKFMKDAMAREQRRADQMVDDFVRELGGGVEGDGEDEEEHEHETDGRSHSHDVLSQRTGGRASFRPGNMTGYLRTVTSLASDTSSVTLKSTDLLPDGTSPSPITTSPLVVPRAVYSPELNTNPNPWLAPLDKSTAAKKKHEVAVGKESGGAEKSKNKLRKRVKKREEEREKEREDAVVDVEMSSVLTLGGGGSAGKSPTKEKKTESHLVVNDDDDEGEDSEVEAQEAALQEKGKGRRKDGQVRAFQQRELVARAFAGDNVVRDFANEKRREMEADAPKEVDTTLAGWGSWGGSGTTKAPPKPYLIKKLAGIDPKSRADYNKRHVVISEKKDKKAAKYQVKDLPYPYTSKAQFERSMDTPLGTEWNTRVGFQRGTLPKVVKKMGTVITPLEKMS